MQQRPVVTFGPKTCGAQTRLNRHIPPLCRRIVKPLPKDRRRPGFCTKGGKLSQSLAPAQDQAAAHRL